MFVRTVLAMSLSCIFTSSVLAAATAEQPLNPQVLSASAAIAAEASAAKVAPQTVNAAAAVVAEASAAKVALQTIDASAAAVAEASAAKVALQTVEASATMTTLTKQEQLEATQANQTLDQLQKTEVPENTTATTTTSPAPAASWTLDGINNAQWSESIGAGQFPMYARAHVMLNNAHASPGAIDGSSGKNTLKAISAFQQMNGLKATGTLNQATWDALVAKQAGKPAFIEHTLTAANVKGPFVKSIPSDYALQSKMKGLYYTRVSEAVAEQFHIDEDFLKKLNPTATFKAGEKILVPNVRNELPEDIHLIVAVKSARQLYLFNDKNQMIASFPATIGGTSTPSPTGTHKIVGVTRNPYYSYSPSNFIQGKNLKPLSLPPGPNGPVGNIWIGLSKRSFGIHGTPNPSMISKTSSHGCIRLTNWDANDLGRKVKSGVTVIFKD